jgi:multidrug resistance efflux pump
MKDDAMKAFLLAVPLLALPLAGAAAQENLRGCAAKIGDLEMSLADSRASDDAERTAGLEKALVRAKERCNDADLRVEREKRVADKREDVLEDERDLLDAERDGDWDDIEDARRDLAESRWELKEAELDLDR